LLESFTERLSALREWFISPLTSLCLSWVPSLWFATLFLD
jgi:hypothetical protein